MLDAYELQDRLDEIQHLEELGYNIEIKAPTHHYRIHGADGTIDILPQAGAYHHLEDNQRGKLDGITITELITSAIKPIRKQGEPADEEL